jgi:hypothetical protein
MSGLEFLFASAWWALPLAAIPLLLHLLFRRRTPVVPFSTLRFVRLSVQQTATRKRVHRWLLLAVRVLALLLLIAAVSQPARRAVAGGSTASATAAIVLDTSHSMLLEVSQVSRLQVAGDAVFDLLTRELAGGRVALFTSRPDAERVAFRPAGEVLSQWAAPTPQPASAPLGDRVAVALDRLRQQPPGDKWLVIATDLQAREFPRPIDLPDDVRVMLLDLRPPASSRSAGVVGVAIEPPDPLPGVGAEIVVEVIGREGDARAVSAALRSLDGRLLMQSPPQVARFDATGRVTLRFAVTLPAERWMLAAATLDGADDLPADDARSTLVEIPPRRAVLFEPNASERAASRFVRLALDPSEGGSPNWPLDVRTSPRGDEQTRVQLVSTWPDLATLQRWTRFAEAGGSLVLMLRPGLEASFDALDEPRRALLDRLLPGATGAVPADRTYRLDPRGSGDGTLADLLAEPFDADAIVVRRLVGFALPPADVRVLLRLRPISSSGGVEASRGLLYERSLGRGRIVTLATLPDLQWTNLPTHPLFLPLLVRAAQPTERARPSMNVELGNPLATNPPTDAATLTLVSPDGAERVVSRSDRGGGFVFADAEQFGVYAWRDAAAVVARSNVQWPADESDLSARAPAEVLADPSPAVIAATLEELRGAVAASAAPTPVWPPIVATVLALLCVESLLGARR